MLAVTGSKPDVYVRLIVLVFCALGTKSQRSKKGGLCAAALAEVRVCGFAAGRLFSIFFCRCVYCSFGLIYTLVGGYGFKTRCARAVMFLGFWCFGDQVTARAKRRVVCGRTGCGCEFGGLPRVACFPFFFDTCFAVLV